VDSVFLFNELCHIHLCCNFMLLYCSIRRRALDLLYGMCDVTNAKEIVEELLQVINLLSVLRTTIVYSCRSYFLRLNPLLLPHSTLIQLNLPCVKSCLWRQLFLQKNLLQNYYGKILITGSTSFPVTMLQIWHFRRTYVTIATMKLHVVTVLCLVIW